MVPSGHQVELRHGDQRVTVVEVGGGLREYTVAGRPVIDGYGVDEMCHDGRGQVLAPWPNRLAGGRYPFPAPSGRERGAGPSGRERGTGPSGRERDAGTQQQTPLSEPERGNAIHGLVRWMAWQAVDRADDRVTMGTVLRPQPGFPFALMMSIEYSLGTQGLRVSTAATNIGEGPLPFGLGFHPYLTVGSTSVDGASLSVPADRVLEADDRGIPTGVERGVDGTAFDLRAGAAIGDRRFDHCLTGLRRDADGLVRVTLAAPDGTPSVSLWCDAAFGYLMVFTGDTLAPERRRRGVAIEPMTCPPDAFNSGIDLLVLDPDSTTTAEWGISPSPSRSSS